MNPLFRWLTLTRDGFPSGLRLSLGLLLSSFLLPSLPVSEAWAGGQEVTYRANGTVLKGYLARPPAGVAPAGDRPAVLVVHEWWGNNAYTRMRADMLAQLGYVALALDMYGDGKIAEHPKDAGAFAGAVRKDMATAEKRFMAARELLASQPGVDGRKIAAVGYCFGGGIVLEMARRGVELSAVVSFHGSLTTNMPAQSGRFAGQVLVLNGAADPLVRPEHISAFHEEMKSAGIRYRFVDYPGAVHAFTNPEATDLGKRFGTPIAYDANADRQSWEEMKALLAQVFR